MESWLQSLVPWGTEVIVWAQSHSNYWLDAVFAFFTFLGYEQFYLLVLPVVYWSIDKRTGMGLGCVSLLSAWVNSAIKFVFLIPRPSDPRIRIPFPETIPSFPSGHAQNAVVNWGYLAYRFRNRAFWLVALVAMVGIGLSRVFLGVHFPQDVIGGWLIGLVLLALYVRAEPPVSRWLGRQSPAVQLVLAVLVPTVLIFLHPADAQGRYPAEGAITIMSALIGLGIGVIMERAWVRFRVDGIWWLRLVRYLIGLLVIIPFYLGPALLIPEHLPPGQGAALRFVRYALLGWVVAFLGPWLFVRLRLAHESGP